MVGRTLSHYRVLEEISRGGMGIVYKAVDLKLNRPIALKVLPPELVADPERKRRFVQEAQAAAALDHPHIAMVHEIDEADGVTFIAMELVEGEKLQDLMTKGRLSPTRSLELALEIAEGLALAHERGIVHRDIKPANVMVSREGHTKIIDFGLAKLVEPLVQDASDTETALRHGTEAGVVMGTVAYMSPEQARGDTVDHRSDVFSFGVVLYEMIAGKHPFRGRTVADTISAILKDPAPPLPEQSSEVSPEARAEIQRILDLCLVKARDERKETMADLVAVLRAVLRLVVSRVALPGRSGRRLRNKLSTAAAVVAGLLVLALVLGWFLAERQRRLSSDLPSSPPRRRSVAVLGFKNLAERPDTKWLSTALSEMFTSELSAGGKLRTIAGENVSRMKIELELPDAESFGIETLARIRSNLGCDLVVLGSYLALGETGGGKIRLDVRLQDAAMGETIATVTDAGTEENLLDLIARTGARLRERLDVGDVSPKDRAGVRASLPSNPEAARLYVEGLARLRLFDALGARDLLERAVALEPGHALAHSVLGKAWSELGYDEKAKAEARKAFELSQMLPSEERLLVEARLRETTSEWERAIEVYRSLFEFFPDNVDYGLSLAEAQTSAGKGKDALATLGPLRQLASPAQVDPRIDLAEASAAGSLSDHQRARTAAAAAAQKAVTQGARLLVARARREEGWALQPLGQLNQAMAAAEEAKSIYAQAGDQGGVALAWQNIFSLLWSQGDLDGAQRAAQELLRIHRTTGRQHGVATGLTDLGLVLWERGDLRGALATFQEALATLREIGDKETVAIVLSNIGAMHTLQAHLEEARRMFEESLAISREIGRKEGMGIALNNLAETREIQGDLDGAKRLYAEALEIGRQTGDESAVAYTLARLAGFALTEGDLEAARGKHNEALAMREKLGAKLAAADSRLGLAEVALEQGRFQDAEGLVRRAVDDSETEKTSDREVQAHELMARVLMAQEKPDEARAAIDRALERARRGQNRLLQMEVARTAARLKAHRSDSSEAVRSLESNVAEAKRIGAVGLELKARLALGEIEIESGRTTDGRTRLQELEKEASSKGFRLIARKAETALLASGTR